MAYEAEMGRLALRARRSFGELLQVYFRRAERDSLLIFERAAIPAAQLSDLLTFGYDGTGPDCYVSFLEHLGFRDVRLEKVPTPSTLRKAGTIRRGGPSIVAPLYGTVVGTGSSVEEARRRATEVVHPEGEIVSETVRCEGSEEQREIVVSADTDSEARQEARNWVPPEFLSYSTPSPDLMKGAFAERIRVSQVLPPEPEPTYQTKIRIEAGSADDAKSEALRRVARISDDIKILAASVELPPPGKKKFTVHVTYQETTKRRKVVVLFYTPPMVEVRYASKKLLCRECRGRMAVVREPVTDKQLTIPSHLATLRCEACNITRVEHSWDVERPWVKLGGSFIPIL